MLEEFKLPADSRATLISTVCKKFEGHYTEKETNESLDELVGLLKTLNIETCGRFIQNRDKIDPATIIGKGKLEDIAECARDNDSDFLVFDVELTATQVRNIKKITGIEVIDRNSVILEIFAQHARTKEAKIQIEISRLEYLLPRLTAFWSHLSRQRGGIGVRGGEGEQQLELDRRIVRKKIEFFKDKLKSIITSREQRNKKRQKNVITAAIVGYTNAGKSSILNKLCKVNVLAEDKLFATLDSTYRLLSPTSHPPMVMIDTVGLISNLPTSLIHGFKSTLEAAKEADLIVIVCDISHPSHEKHLKVTSDFLKELGLGQKDKMIIFNKKDLLNNQLTALITVRAHPNSFLISSQDDQDIKNIRNTIIEFFLSKQKAYDLFIPYEEAKAHTIISSQTNIVIKVIHQRGIFYRIRVPDFLFQRLSLGQYKLAPEDELPDQFRTDQKTPLLK